MKRYTLNIGLNVKNQHRALTLGKVITEVERAINPYYGHVLSLNVHTSDSEPTAVVVVEAEDVAGGAWWHLAADLEQEAVGVWDEVRATGSLEGPSSGTWGIFNPSRFLMPDGKYMNADRPSVDKLVEMVLSLADALESAHDALEYDEEGPLRGWTSGGRSLAAKFGK